MTKWRVSYSVNGMLAETTVETKGGYPADLVKAQYPGQNVKIGRITVERAPVDSVKEILSGRISEDGSPYSLVARSMSKNRR